ncbi:MAG TPA: hypothetical protein VJ183_19745 [Chloroflexia bacterium]|nr:hypothetical protein [Chloroflexia bacterium]
MTVLPHILLVVGVSTLLALWCGWGLARLTLPSSLKPWNGLLALLLGYALVLVVGYWGVRDWVGIPLVLMVLIPATGLLNALAWVRTGPPRLPKRPLVHAPLAALLAVTLLVGAAPLISYDHPAIIGDGWDVENYLPVAHYLERGPVSAIPSAPPNPLRDYNADPPKNGLTLGFSIWQGSVDTLIGQEAITTFAPLLAWLRMLGVIAVYVLFRSMLGLKRWFALLGAGFVSAGGLLLWVEYTNFGMQLAAWPLIPLGLVVGISSTEELARRGLRSWPVIIGAALAIAAIPVAYYPALTLFAPLAIGLGMATLFRSEHRARIFVAAAVLAAVTLIMSIPAVIDYFQGFSYRYGQQLTTLGLFRYVPLTDFAGLTHFSLRSEPPVPLLSLIAFAVMCALMGAGLIWGRKRVAWAGFALGGIAYMLWLWSQQYPYAWMKGGAYAAFPFLGLAAMGAQGVAIGRRTMDDGRKIEDDDSEGGRQTTDDRRRSIVEGQASRITHHALRWGSVAVALSLLLLMGITQAQTVAEHWREPGLYAKEMPAILDLRAKIPAGSRVTLTSDPRINGVTTGLAAYMLDQASILGSASTGYVPSWSNGEPGEVGDYALLLSGEDPDVYGFSGQGRLWQGGSFTLYKRDSVTLAHRSLDRTMQPGDTLDFSFEDKYLNNERSRVWLAVAALEPGKLDFNGRTIDISAGGSLISNSPFDEPGKIMLVNSGTTPVIVRWARLKLEREQGDLSMDAQVWSALAQARAQVNGNTVTTTVDTLLPKIGPVTLALDIWDSKRNAHYGWYGVEQPRTESRRTFTLTLDLPSGIMTGIDEAGVPIAIGGGLEGLQRGDYIASLNMLAGTHLLAAPEEVFSFSIGPDGEVSNVRASAPPALAVRADTPPVPLSVMGPQNDVGLIGYAVSEAAAHPGGEVSITLWWRSYSSRLDERSILIHLRDSKGERRAQADGSPANGGHPTTTWQNGDTVIDQHALKIPADLPPGQYNLAVGMYHYPSLELVPLTQFAQLEDGAIQPTKPLDGNVVLIPIQIKP